MVQSQKRKFRATNLLLVLLLVLFSFSFGLTAVFAETNYNDLINKKKQEKAGVQSELEKSQKRAYLYLQSGLTTSQKIAAIEKDYQQLQADVEKSIARMTEVDKLLKDKQLEINSQRTEISRVSRSAYKISRVNLLDMVLASNGVTDLVQKVAFHRAGLKSLMDQMNSMEGDLSQTASDFNGLSDESSRLEANIEFLKREKIALQNQKHSYEQLAAAEQSRQNDLISDLSIIDGEIGRLSKEAEEAMKRKSGGGPGSGGGGGGGGGGSPQNPAPTPGHYDLYNGSTKVGSNIAGPVRFVPTSASNFSIDNGRGRYRGTLEVRSDTNVFLINELPFETYLRGIGEMSSSWHMEALKSQAVAARTYGAANWSKRLSLKYNLRDDTYDQNYVGYSKEIGASGSRWVSAVTNTQGRVIKAGGRLITAYYHSTCGGHTLSSAEVWGGTRSYAQAESDWYESNGTIKSYDGASPWFHKRWGTSNINLAGLEDLINAAIWLEINHGSTASQDNIVLPGGWNADQLKAHLGNNAIRNRIGAIQSVTQIYNSGSSSIALTTRYTQTFRVVGANGTKDLPGYLFRLAFNIRAPGKDTLYSSLWDVKLQSGSYNFYSYGAPHRVGLCQYGAQGRAQAGKTYIQILAHYYHGSQLSNFAPPSAFRVGITHAGGSSMYISADGLFDVYANGVKVASGANGQSWKIVKK